MLLLHGVVCHALCLLAVLLQFFGLRNRFDKVEVSHIISSFLDALPKQG